MNDRCSLSFRSQYEIHECYEAFKEMCYLAFIGILVDRVQFDEQDTYIQACNISTYIYIITIIFLSCNNPGLSLIHVTVMSIFCFVKNKYNEYIYIYLINVSIVV